MQRYRSQRLSRLSCKAWLAGISLFFCASSFSTSIVNTNTPDTTNSDTSLQTTDITKPDVTQLSPNQDNVIKNNVIKDNVTKDNVAKNNRTKNNVTLPLTKQSDDYKDQRKYYRQTLTAIRKGHKTNSQRGLKKLQSYPLYSYLLKAKLARNLKKLPYTEVDQYLAEYGDTVAGMQLRRSWLSVLAKKHQWQNYINYFQPEVRSSGLRCLYLEALHQRGHISIAHDKTSEIWLSGKSLPDECDSVFKRWRQAGGKTDTLVWERVKRSLDAKNTMLARYLSERASAKLKPYTRRLINVHRKPRRLAITKDFKKANDYNVDIVTHGLLRLASKDADLAYKLWVDYRGRIDFTAEQYHNIRNKLARQVIASGEQDALQWLVANDPNAEDSYLLEWRIRLALKQQQWSKAGNWIALLPGELQNQPRWRYWLARVYQETDQNLQNADELMQNLAKERHYYGFLAADTSGNQYDFNHITQSLPDEAGQIREVPSLKRAYEFYKLGELTAARREWRSGINTFDLVQLSSATALAHSWGWHQQAIHTTIKANQWNDLSIRFPLAYQSHMVDAAKTSTIRLEWLYAIARQESAFADDAYSSAGARGLLQIRPSTAKKVADKLGVKYRAQDLYKADKNIALGSEYLKQLLADFKGNHILATAAYNAGPYRVKKWLSRQGKALPYDIWIETLPFYETRSYVQNVLAFSVIYGYRLGINAPLIGKTEAVIE